MTGPASDVFISYKAEDRKRLTPLVKALEDEGFDVWWDQHIGSGTNWRDEIETHLDAAKVVIVVWSKKTIGPEGRFVRDEAGQAQEAGHYLPITVDNVRPPLGFREVQALDLSSWKGNRADPRFQVLTDTIRHRLAGKEIGRKALVVGNAPVSRRGVMIGGGAATAAVAAGVLGWQFLMPRAANAKRIAVLPFANLSGSQEQAYFAEGVAEELRGALSRIGLEVIGRASSDAVKDLDTKAAAAKLGVGNILSGSVRRSANMVRIGAQLVDGSEGVERWSQNYDRAPGDEIKIQTDIASSVAQALAVALGQAAKAALTLGGTTDAHAQDLYLRAASLRQRSRDEKSTRETINLLDAAIARDSRYAAAWRYKSAILEQIAIGGTVDFAAGLDEAEKAARRAIEIAPDWGRPYADVANIEMDRLNFAAALQNMERALALLPNQMGVLSVASNFMQFFGDPQKALSLANRALALDPLQAVSYGRRGEVLLFALRRYPAAIADFRKSLEIAPGIETNNTRLAICLLLMGRPQDAMAELRQVVPDDLFRLTVEGILSGRTGDLVEVERIVAKIRKMAGDGASFQYAQIYAQAGKVERAFAELDNAVRVKDPGLQSLKSDPFLDPLIRDPRFASLLKRLNFPTWS